MMFDYHAAVRGAFFDIAEVAESADDIARQARYLEDGVLFLRDGRIQALLPWQEGERFLHPQKGYRDLRGKLLLPGFVDAHVHYPQTEMIGAFGEQLLEWLTTYTFPVESQFADADYAAEIAQFFVNQLLSHGTTTALVFCTLHPESVDALFNEALRLNMRLIAGKVMMDRHAPEYLSESAEQSYRQTRTDSALAPARPSGIRHYAALRADLNAGTAGGGAAAPGRVSRYLAAYPPERKPQ